MPMRKPSTGAPSTRACSSPRASTFRCRANGNDTASAAANSASSGPGRRAQRQIAHQPEQHAAQLRLIAQREQHADDRAGAGRDDDAGQQQSRRGPAAFAVREREHEQRRGQRAGGCGGIDRRYPPRPSSMAASAATAAPPETPMTNGSASGLRSSTCISTPAIASSAAGGERGQMRAAVAARKSATWASGSACRDQPRQSSCSAETPTLPLSSDSANAAECGEQSRNRDRQR